MNNLHLSRRKFLGSSLGSVSILVPSVVSGCTLNETNEHENTGQIVGNISKLDIDTPALLVDLGLTQE